ncbi:hypothetical protein GGI35DRAFT_65364 [Trichoderma velutinum]
MSSHAAHTRSLQLLLDKPRYYPCAYHITRPLFQTVLMEPSCKKHLGLVARFPMVAASSTLLSTRPLITFTDPITARSVPARNQSLADARLDRPHRLTFRAPSLSPHAALSGWNWQGGREPRYIRLCTRITCTLRYARYELGYWKLKARTTCRILFFNSRLQLPSPVPVQLCMPLAAVIYDTPMKHDMLLLVRQLLYQHASLHVLQMPSPVAVVTLFSNMTRTRAREKGNKAKELSPIFFA